MYESEIWNKLVVDEKDLTEEVENLVANASKHFRIEKLSGKITFQNFGALNDKQRIAVVLLGKYFAEKLKIIENPALSISEIGKELGRPITTLSGNMKGLVSKGYVEYLPEKKYVVAHHRIKEIFNEVLNKQK